MTITQIPEAEPRIRYAANGTQKSFAFPYPFHDAAHVKVWLNAAPQSSGFAVTGAGHGDGGTVTFDSAPAAGLTITLERRVPIARTAGFSESAAFSAAGLNGAFDSLTMQAQQIQADQALMLHYDVKEAAASATLPDRSVRAGKALAFDGDGNPTVVEHGSSIGPPAYVPGGPGAQMRTMQDKLAEQVSVKDFGAVGTGLVDDTLAFQAALAAATTVFVPAGIYLFSQPIDVGYGKRLFGAGQSSTLKAASNDGDLIRLPDSYAQIDHLRLEGGMAGIRLFGRDGPCVQNAVQDVTIWYAETGMVLDGYTDTDRPCYWNNFDRVLIAKHNVHGVHLMRSGAGDTPNANRFHMLRVYSLATGSTGIGIYLEAGRYNNAFTDCEVNLETTAAACVRLGAQAEKNLFVNLYTETLAAIDNIILDAGSSETAIINLFSASAGKAIQDYSGGKYIAINAGYPDKNRLTQTRATDLTVELLRYDTAYIEAAEAGTVALDLSASLNLVSAQNGEMTIRLPGADATGANGAAVTVKKIDQSAHAVLVEEADGPGPDGRTVRLTKQYDSVTVVSNGAGWWVLQGSVEPSSYAFDESGGTVTPDVRRPLMLVSAAAADTEVQLPPADGFDVPGRMLTIKRTDDTANMMTVTEHGGDGPDGAVIRLSFKGAYVTVASNGSAWWVVGDNTRAEQAFFSEAAGTVDIDPARRLQIISAYAGDTTVQLPPAGDPDIAGRVLTIKRSDDTSNAMTVTESGGDGPDGAAVVLPFRGAYITVMSNAANWWIIGGNVDAEQAYFSEAGGLIEIDGARRLYMISAWADNTEVRLPKASDATAQGRLLTIKRVDNHATNTLQITETGGPGPDSVTLPLSGMGHAVTMMSDGGYWRILSMHP